MRRTLAGTACGTFPTTTEQHVQLHSVHVQEQDQQSYSLISMDWSRGACGGGWPYPKRNTSQQSFTSNVRAISAAYRGFVSIEPIGCMYTPARAISSQRFISVSPAE